jgi:fructosamine-3-kinase
MSDYACHHAALLSDNSYSVFAKFSEAVDGVEQFECELAGLRLLTERTGVLTPTPVGIVPAAGGSILVLEAVQAVERAPRHWRQIGRTLAHIHRIKGDRFGWDRDGYIGPLHQDNTPTSDWATFFAERRLQPGLRLAVDSGHLPPAVIRQMEKLVSRVPQLCGPAVVPTLLHGDAQQNNFVSTDLGPVVIDPAVYYGNPEVDLAAIDLWQAAPGHVLDGYQEELPIDPGFWERRHLWRAYWYLAAVTVEGASHLGRLTGALHKIA